jgi:ATP-binding cassette, subfamily G (WHITE), member 2, PDR
VRFLRKLCDAGQAILCTIHQPSAILFEHFDSLLLLQSGGRTVYFGPLGQDSQTLIRYLQRNGAPNCPKNANPAEYMLDAIGAGAASRSTQDWNQLWLQSAEFRQLTSEISTICEAKRQVPESELMKDQREYAMSMWTQIVAVTKRTFTSYWRDPNYLLGKYAPHGVSDARVG